MNDGNLPFLEEQPTEEVIAEPEFKPELQPEPESKGEPEPAPPAEPKEDRHIPISALLDEREKRQAREREAEELRRKLAEYEAQKKPDDFYDNPEAFLQKQQAVVQAALWNERLNTSEILARKDAGNDVVDAARDAFMTAAQQSPALAAEFRSQADPYGFVVKWHKKQSVLAKLGDDPEAYIEAQIQARLSQQVQPPAKAPPPSLAAAPSAGGQEPPPSGFKAMFGE